MSYLLDGTVLREMSRPRPSAKVVAWLGEVPEDSLHVSVMSLGELRSAIEEVRGASRRERLRVFVERDLPARLGDRLLPVDAAVAQVWGRLAAEAGRPVGAVEGLLAATALSHGLRVATRNVRDFRFPGLEIVDPWEVGGRQPG